MYFTLTLHRFININEIAESARIAVEDGERTEMPDFIEMVTEELRRFGTYLTVAICVFLGNL